MPLPLVAGGGVVVVTEVLSPPLFHPPDHAMAPTMIKMTMMMPATHAPVPPPDGGVFLL